MYGQIHVVFREMVLQKYGNEAWKQVLSQASMDGEQDFLQFKNYPDEGFYRMIQSISRCVGEPLEEMMEEFGDFFTQYCLNFGYDNMLRTLGSDIVSFVQNLDSLHSLLSLTYRGINPPSFRCESTADGDLLLHYYSCRSGLSPLVVGLIRAAGREIFQHTVNLTKLHTVKEDLGEGKSQEHTVFSVHFPDMASSPIPIATTPFSAPVPQSPARSQTKLLELTNHVEEGKGGEDQIAETASVMSCGSLMEDKITLNGRQFCETFPYHVFFDTQLVILQCGNALKRMLPAGVGPGSSMMAAFQIQYPRMAWSFENILRFTNTIFMLTLRTANGYSTKALNIKGQMLWLAEEERMMFIGSPSLKSLKEMKEIDIHMSDIPLFDVTREIVLLYEQRNAEIGITQKLDQTTEELKRISLALEEEKQKTEQLLHQMLPPKVAMQLKNGHIVEAETFQTATILFSDIVTFTNIAALCPPESIVDMLNDMYERFDKATTRHDVYKVETIGDAYMVVGGVPEKSPDHVQRVARFAIDILGQAAEVPSPATGKPLQIRIGVHVGAVMAGVVGIKMPRYCLFGDTVNTASRMESHGVPGRIHLSSQAHQYLEDNGFLFKRRGSIQIKGKGYMTTYFLVGESDVSRLEPDDEYKTLPVMDDVTPLSTTSNMNGSNSSNNQQGCTVRVADPSKVEDQEPLKNGSATASKVQKEHTAETAISKRRVSPRLVKPDYAFLVSSPPPASTAQSGNAQHLRSRTCTIL